MSITIEEEYTLPSLGKIYDTEFDPHVKLRSMTVAEEMKRLTVSDTPYRVMCDIIDACITSPIPMSSYDMCLGDYQFLLHKLRSVTYGSDYKIPVQCPYCGEMFDATIDLDALNVNEYDVENPVNMFVELPMSKDKIELRFQTPRSLDEIEQKKKKLRKEFPDMKDDTTLMLTLGSVIASVNGSYMTPSQLDSYIKKMSMRDSNVILHAANKLNGSVGVDVITSINCTHCHEDVYTSFRYTNEFFRPSIDD